MKLALCLVATLIVFGTFGFLFGKWAVSSPELDRFLLKGKGIYAVVKEKYPDQHATVRYTYEVDGREYSGVGGTGYGNPRFEELTDGQRVVIYYDIDDPSKSLMGYPEGYEQQNRMVILLCTVLTPIVAIISVPFWYLLFRSARKNKDRSVAA